MIVEIMQYKGWQISFETNVEKFYAISYNDDLQKEKASLSAAKKFIDEFIKDNQNFKPVKVRNMAGAVFTLIGIRKDGLFVCEDKEGKKETMSSYNEIAYFVVDSINDATFEQIESLQSERKAIGEKICNLETKLVKVTISELRKKILGN